MRNFQDYINEGKAILDDIASCMIEDDMDLGEIANYLRYNGYCQAPSNSAVILFICKDFMDRANNYSEYFNLKPNDSLNDMLCKYATIAAFDYIINEIEISKKESISEMMARKGLKTYRIKSSDVDRVIDDNFCEVNSYDVGRMLIIVNGNLYMGYANEK